MMDSAGAVQLHGIPGVFGAVAAGIVVIATTNNQLVEILSFKLLIRKDFHKRTSQLITQLFLIHASRITFFVKVN